MEKKKIQVGVTVWKRFITYDFEIAPSLPGSEHCFEYQGYPITIVLPSKPSKKEEENWKSRIYCRSWKKTSTGLRPSGYEVNDVDVYLDTGRQRLIPNDPFRRRRNTLFNKQERASLEKLRSKYEIIIDEAFAYWVDVLRWKTGFLGTCRYITERQKVSWSMDLLETKTRERFFSASQSILVSASSYISKRSWTSVQKAVSFNAQVPLWHIYLAEADHQIGIGQTRRCIIDLAIAIESLIRVLTSDFISDSATPKFHSFVDRISVMQLFEKWNQLGFKSKHWRDIREDKKYIKEIIDKRNGIMHRGESPDISNEERGRLFNAARNFIEAGELELKRRSEI